MVEELLAEAQLGDDVDNQNTIPEWGADTPCRLVTGEADSKRRLYTDDEDVIIELTAVFSNVDSGAKLGI